MSSNMTDDYLYEVVSEYCEENLPSNDEIGTIEVSKEFSDNMNRLIRSVDESSYKYNKRRALLKWAACSAAALALAFVIIGINDDVQAGALAFIKSLFTKGFDGYEVTTKINDSNEITGFSVGYMPEGYELADVKNNHDLNVYEYINGESRIVFMYYHINDVPMFTYVDNEYREHEIVKLNDGTKCDYYVDNKENLESNLIWKKGQYVCYLVKDGTDAQYDLVKVANSIIPEYE